MNSIRKSFVVSSLLGVILLAGVPGAAQADSVGPYYATPSWDQTLPAATRFIVLSNFAGAAVLDRDTGLVWERSPDTTGRTWPFAQYHCNDRNVGNRKGWRLPTIQELASLIDPTVPSPGPTLPAGHPFINVLSNFYWSATSGDPTFNVAWIVFFFNGSVNLLSKVDENFVWCVRGGQGVDPQ